LTAYLVLCLKQGEKIVHELVDDFIEMNKAGLVLELCEKHYDENVIMLNNGTVFAESMHEAYDKQKSFVGSIIKFDVKLVSKVVDGNISELTFHYKMTGSDSNLIDFIGKHVQTWKNNKIVREEYFSVE
jgi:hypothetical protein